MHAQSEKSPNDVMATTVVKATLTIHKHIKIYARCLPTLSPSYGRLHTGILQKVDLKHTTVLKPILLTSTTQF